MTSYLLLKFIILFVLGKAACSLSNIVTTQLLVIGEPMIVALTCSDNTTNDQVTWTINGLPLESHSNKLVLRDGKLFILTASRADVGEYRCKVSNSAEERIIQLIELELRSELLTNVTVFEFENLSLNCPVKGTPTPLIKWFKNGEPLQEVVGRSRLELSPNEDSVPNATLVIRSALQSDAGTYTCQFSSFSFENTTSIEVQVTGISHRLETLQSEIQELKMELSRSISEIRSQVGLVEGNLAAVKKEQSRCFQGCETKTGQHIPDGRMINHGCEQCFLCYRGTLVSVGCPKVPEGYTTVNEGCYKTETQNKYWYVARENCKEMGGDLAKPPADIEAFKEFIQKSRSRDHWWLGARRKDSESPFTYLKDGTLVDDSLWAEYQPNNDGDCVHIFPPSDPALYDNPCNVTRNSVCEWTP